MSRAKFSGVLVLNVFVVLKIFMLASLLLVTQGCDDGETITGPDDVTIVLRVRNGGNSLFDFVFNQNVNTGNVSLVIQNLLRQDVVSFDYSINYSISGQGWVVSDSSGPIPVGRSVDEGIIVTDSPILTERGFSITVSSIVTTDPDV